MPSTRTTGFQPVGPEPRLTRRNLPHLEAGGSTYFVTFGTAGVDLTPHARQLVLRGCRHFDGRRYVLWAVVVMPDHAHMLLTPVEQAPGKWWPLSRILHSIKSYSAKQINESLERRGTVWRGESFDRIIRGERDFGETLNYVRMNPVRMGLCGRPGEWDAVYERAEGVDGSTGWKPVPLVRR